METERINPLFKIAIRGDMESANKIHKFFSLNGAVNIHNLTFKHKNVCYFAVKHADSNNILIGCTSFDEIASRKEVSLEEAKKLMQEWEESLRQPKQKRRKKKEIHKSNCVNRVRFTVTDQLGNIVTVCGKYAYEWTININKNGMVIQTSFESRRKALNELNRIVGKKIK